VGVSEDNLRIANKIFNEFYRVSRELILGGNTIEKEILGYGKKEGDIDYLLTSKYRLATEVVGWFPISQHKKQVSVELGHKSPPKGFNDEYDKWRLSELDNMKNTYNMDLIRSNLENRENFCGARENIVEYFRRVNEALEWASSAITEQIKAKQNVGRRKWKKKSFILEELLKFSNYLDYKGAHSESKLIDKIVEREVDRYGEEK